MLDREGFRPNVGIILLNARNEVFWGKRLREHSWQFPQGGIKFGENPVQAMYRELHEEVGLKPQHVKVLGRTRDWLRYEVPDKFIKREVRGHYRGQKQIWFLLRMVGRDCDICLRATDHPEFDAWRWNEYWVPLDAVIEFKRDVYQLALSELSRFMRRAAGAQAEHARVNAANGETGHGEMGDGERHPAGSKGAAARLQQMDRSLAETLDAPGTVDDPRIAEPHVVEPHVVDPHVAPLSDSLQPASSSPLSPFHRTTDPGK